MTAAEKAMTRSSRAKDSRPRPRARPRGASGPAAEAGAFPSFFLAFVYGFIAFRRGHRDPAVHERLERLPVRGLLRGLRLHFSEEEDHVKASLPLHRAIARPEAQRLRVYHSEPDPD